MAKSNRTEYNQCEPPSNFVDTNENHSTAKNIDLSYPSDMPIGTGLMRHIAIESIKETYNVDDESKANVDKNPKPLIDYLDNLQKSIEQKHAKLDALDAKIASEEKHSPDLSEIRAEISEVISFDEKLYKELKSYLDNALEGSELKPPNE